MSRSVVIKQILWGITPGLMLPHSKSILEE
jgi:hypothetical protein